MHAPKRLDWTIAITANFKLRENANNSETLLSVLCILGLRTFSSILLLIFKGCFVLVREGSSHLEALIESGSADLVLVFGELQTVEPRDLLLQESILEGDFEISDGMRAFPMLNSAPILLEFDKSWPLFCLDLELVSGSFILLSGFVDEGL